MKRALLLLAATSMLTLSGCGPKESAPALAAKKDEATVQREWLYGSRAVATDIVWKPSGLGIRLLAPGEGTPPKPTDRVRVNFKCVLKDGKVIDDSQARGGPI